jgi:hypothetical protein
VSSIRKVLTLLEHVITITNEVDVIFHVFRRFSNQTFILEYLAYLSGVFFGRVRPEPPDFYGPLD